MKLIALATLFTLASAHELQGRHARLLKRQDPPSSSVTVTSTTTSVASSTSSGPVPTTSGTPPGPTGPSSDTNLPPPTTGPPEPAPSGQSTSTGTSNTSSGTGTGTQTNTTPVIMTTPIGPGTDIPPLASIVSGAPPEATAPLPTTYRAGEEGPFSGAPPLPTACKYSTFFLSPVARSLPCHPIQFVGRKCSHAKNPLVCLQLCLVNSSGRVKTRFPQSVSMGLALLSICQEIKKKNDAGMRMGGCYHTQGSVVFFDRQPPIHPSKMSSSSCHQFQFNFDERSPSCFMRLFFDLSLGCLTLPVANLT